MDTSASHPRKPRRTWLIPAAVALVIFIGQVASNLVAADLDTVLKPYRPVVWVVFGLALIAAVATAIADARKQTAPPATPPPGPSGPTVTIQHARAGRDIIAVAGDQVTTFDQRGQTVQTQTNIAGSVTGPVLSGEFHGPVTVGAVPIGAQALHQLSAPPPDFTGREAELDDLLRAVETSGVPLSGMYGLGGIGKTALALVLAKRLTPRYPDAQFVLDLRGTTPNPLTPAEAMTHVIRSYHPTAKLPESDTELRGLYCSVLSGQRAMLLMDNARDAAQVEPLLPPASCLLFVTSRQHFVLPGLYAKNLGMLPVEDAEGLLLKIAPRIDGHAAEMARLCGYLPLALRASASALAERVDVAPGDHLRRLSDITQRLKLTGVEASLTASFELLPGPLQAQWCQLAVFVGGFDRAAAAAVLAVEDDAAAEALSELARYSLVEWNETTQRFRLHDLVRLFADARLGETDRAAAGHHHAAHYQKVLWSANQLFLQGGESITRGLALFDLEWPNIQGGQMWAKANTAESNKSAEICSNFAWTGSILNLRLHPREYVGWLEAALVAARQTKNREAEGAHLGNLGNANCLLGDFRRAIEFYEQHLVIAREICAASRSEAERTEARRGEGIALGNLGNAYKNLDEPRRAIEFYEQCLEIHREICAASRSEAERTEARRGEGQDLGNLGSAHYSLGDARKALEFYEQALVIAREIGDWRGEGTVLFNMSLALDKLGDRAQAIAQAKAALKIYEQIEDPHTDAVREQLVAWRGEK